MGGGRVYTMFAAPVNFVEPLMFHLATQHNAAAEVSVAGAEKTSFAWAKGALSPCPSKEPFSPLVTPSRGPKVPSPRLSCTHLGLPPQHHLTHLPGSSRAGRHLVEAIRGALTVAEPASTSTSMPLPRPGTSVRVVVRGLGGRRRVRLMPAFVQSLARLLASPAAAFLSAAPTPNPNPSPLLRPPTAPHPASPLETFTDPTHMCYWLAHLAANPSVRGGAADEPCTPPEPHLTATRALLARPSSPTTASTTSTTTSSTTSTKRRNRKRRAPPSEAAAASPRARQRKQQRTGGGVGARAGAGDGSSTARQGKGKGKGGWREEMAAQGLPVEQFWANRAQQWCGASPATAGCPT